jgi:hypothetical protein
MKPLGDDRDDDQEDESNKPLTERIHSLKWKARQAAYKEISDLFYHVYSNQCITKKKG